MAVPVVAGWTVNDSGGAAVSSIELTKPGSVAVGDLLVLIVGSDETNVAGWQDLSGWTKVVNANAAAADAELGVYWRIAQGDEDATIIVYGGSNDERYGWYLRITHANGFPTNPINVLGTPQATGAAASHTADQVTTDEDDCLAFFAFAYDGADGGVFSTSSTGWTMVDTQESGTAGTDAEGGWGTKPMVSQGLTGDVVIDHDGEDDGCTRVQFAIEPSGIVEGVGTITCTSTAAAIGTAILIAVGSIACTSTAAATASSTAASIGSITCASTVAAVGTGVISSAGTVTCASTASATGASTAASMGTVTCVSTVAAYGTANLNVPVVASWTEDNADDGWVDTITLDKPPGVSVGDLLLIIVGSRTPDTCDWETVSGWTRFVCANASGVGADLALYWRIATGGEGSTIDVTSSSYERRWGYYVRITGAHATTPLHIVGTPQSVDEPGVTHVINEITTTIDNCLALFAFDFNGGDGPPMTPSDSGWSKIDDIVSYPSEPLGVSGCWGTKEMPSAGATGDVTITTTQIDGSSRVQFAVRPPPAVEESVGTITCTSTAAAVGASTSASVGTVTCASTVAAVGTGIKPSVGSIACTSAVAADGEAIKTSVGTITCTSIVAAVGTRLWYISPTGNDSTGDGTKSNPWKFLQKAVDNMSAGDSCICRGGTTTYTDDVVASGKNGTAPAMYHVLAYPGETPVFNFNGADITYYSGIYIYDSAYWHFKGITIENAPDGKDCLVFAWASTNFLAEDCVARWGGSTGFWALGSGASRPNGGVFRRCISHDHETQSQHGEHGDGFGANLASVTFEDCIAYKNADSGFDLVGSGEPCTLNRCVAYLTGWSHYGDSEFIGNGHGFNAGGDDVVHTIKNCVAYDNEWFGFVGSSDSVNYVYYNCTAYHNGYDIGFGQIHETGGNFYIMTDQATVIRNCISYDGRTADQIHASADDQYNSWNDPPDVTVTDADFESLVEGHDYYLHLVIGSDCINAGTDVGIPYYGSDPDLGAYEWEPHVSESVGTITCTSTAAAVGASTAASDGSSAGVATSAAVGASTAASVGTVTCTSTSDAVGASIYASAGTSAGVATSAATGAAIFASDGTITCTSTAAAVGQALTVEESVGTIICSSIAAAVGASTAASDGTATGTATSAAIGASTAESDGSVACAATSAATGTGIVASVGTVTCTSTALADGEGVQTIEGVGTSAGVATVAAIGASTAASAGTVTCTSTALAEGSTAGVVNEGAGTVTCTSTASATGASTAASIGSSDGVATSAAVGTGIVSSIGTISASAVSAAVGAAVFASIGTSAGIATSIAVGSSTAASVGSSAGIATSTAIGAATAESAGSVAAIATTAATGASIFSSAGSVTALCVVTGQGTGIFSSSGSVTCLATVAGQGGAYFSGVGSVSCVSTALAVGRAVGIISAVGSVECVSTVIAESDYIKDLRTFVPTTDAGRYPPIIDKRSI